MPLVEYPVRHVVIDSERDGQRVDNFLLGQFKGVPKSFVYRILRRGEVRANGKRIKPEYRLATGDELRLPPVRIEEAPVIAPSENLDIVRRLAEYVIYETPEMLVINKPAGVAVHGGSGVDYGVIEALRSGRGDLKYLELVHRLDRDTSGCLMIAKKRSALRCLHEQLRLKTMHKHYWALVHGRWPSKVTVVNEPLLKNVLKSGERFVRVDRNGKPSCTDFEVIKDFENASLVMASPRTGRTHQIRVHCAFKHHPIVMDEKYGDREMDSFFARLGLRRMFLHARTIVFSDPGTGKQTTVDAPLDEHLQSFLDRLGARNSGDCGNDSEGSSESKGKGF